MVPPQSLVSESSARAVARHSARTPQPSHTRRQPILGAWEAVRWIALFRLALPSVILRYAGGREVTLRDLQAIGMTAGINALIVGNYLTTLGRRGPPDARGPPHAHRRPHRRHLKPVAVRPFTLCPSNVSRWPRS